MPTIAFVWYKVKCVAEITGSRLRQAVGLLSGQPTNVMLPQFGLWYA